MSDDLIAKLRHGCIYHPRRWSGDTHADLGWSIQEAETDALMREAADRIESLQATIQQQSNEVDTSGEAVAVFACEHCPVSIESNWREPDCPECGERCHLDKTAKPFRTHPPKPVEGWYCPQCKRTVPPVEVTYSEHHESCGTSVGTPPPKPVVSDAMVFAAIDGFNEAAGDGEPFLSSIRDVARMRFALIDALGVKS